MIENKRVNIKCTEQEKRDSAVLGETFFSLADSLDVDLATVIDAVANINEFMFEEFGAIAFTSSMAKTLREEGILVR